jgi:hypothetical protein
MQKLPLSPDRPLYADKARLMSLGTLIDTREPRKTLLNHGSSRPKARAVTTPADPALALKAQLPTGHPS